jgi:tetratricopeptide (TPR) repeat protein
MKSLMSCLLGLALVGAAPAWADPDDDDAEKMVGGELPPLSGEPRSPVKEFDDDHQPTLEELKNRPLPNEAYVGAKMLDLDPQFVNAVQVGLEQMYRRDYNGARDTFEAMEQTFPNTAVGEVIDMLVWQALMLENFDYKYDKQYWTSSKAAREALDKAMAEPGNESWEHLLMAAVLGVESIHTMRKTQYLSALNLAFQAMDHIEKSRKANPDFIDLQLADGMYNYWRSVVTLSTNALPDFGDERLKGIEQMQTVERAGVFLKPMATLSLAFSWMEEKEYKKAGQALARNERRYPDNIINNMVTGTNFIYQKDFDSALERFAKIEKVDPKNMRVHYWKGVALIRSKKPDEALVSLKKYLAYEHLEDYQRSWTLYRIGQAQRAKKQWGEAYESFKAAHKVDGHKAAKTAMDRLKDRKKDGKIDF